MAELVSFLVGHGHVVVFTAVLAEQIGLPVPSTLALLGAGALAATGELSAAGALVAAVAACVIGDALWYEIGRRRGTRVLNLICRISLEPDSCVRRTEEMFVRYGARSLVVAKFVPGLSTAAPPLAGIFRMRLSRFLLFDAVGSAVWAGVFLALGYLAHRQLEAVAAAAMSLGRWLFVVVAGGLALYIAAKYLHRRSFLRRLSAARITPEELNRRIAAGEPIVVADLRTSLDFEAEPETIPGAVRMAPEELTEHHERIPRDRDIVLYCT